MAKSKPVPPVIRPRLPLAEQIRQRAIHAGFASALPKSDVYVFTSAVDGAPVHAEFFGALKRYVRHRKKQGWRASLHVIPVLMRNVTRRKAERGTTAALWAPELRPFLFAGRSDLIPHLSIVGDLKVQATAVSPISRLSAMSGRRSVLMGHPRLELTTVATPGSDLPKILTSTGAVTALDYTDSGTGKISEFHHCQSAVVIEVDWRAGLFFMTQLTASSETGEFTDMEWHYTPRGVKRAERPAALVLADTHFGFHSLAAEREKFRSGGTVARLRPRHLVWHDLKDGYSHNHHEAKDVFARAGKMGTWAEMVRDEVMDAARYAEEHTPDDCLSVVVSSNHDEFLTTWIRDSNWKHLTTKDNMLFYLATAHRMLEGQKLTRRGVETPSPFVMWGREAVDPKRVRFLTGDEPFALAGVSLEMHGHKGPGGARGNIKNLSRIGVKVVINHGHGPNIREGGWQGGTNSILDPVYAGGPSNWMHADVLLHASGKRQMIFTINGRSRLLKRRR